MKIQKKGSISLSINMIVFVVIAFVMLGLMLGLGRSIMNQADEGATSLLGQTKQDIENQLIQTDVPLYFSQREYDVGFGERVTLNFGVKNVNPIAQDYKILIEYISPSGTATSLDPSKTADAETGGAFFWARIGTKYSPGEGKASDVQYRAPFETDTYIFKFKLVLADDETNIIGEELIYINVA